MPKKVRQAKRVSTNVLTPETVCPVATCRVSLWSPLVTVGTQFQWVQVLILVFARMTNFLPALVIFGLLGIPNSANNVALEPLLFQTTPRNLIGRVFAVLTPLWTLAYIASVALTGYSESVFPRQMHIIITGITFGPIDAILTGTGLLVIIGGIFAMISLMETRQ